MTEKMIPTSSIGRSDPAGFDDQLALYLNTAISKLEMELIHDGLNEEVAARIADQSRMRISTPSTVDMLDTYQLQLDQDKIHGIRKFIDNWLEAYPTDMFPEPDLRQVAKVLKENGLSLDSVSASNMRHVLNRIKVELDDLESKTMSGSESP